MDNARRRRLLTPRVPAAAIHGGMQETLDGEELTLDLLAGSWRIYQLKRGHRFSTDDLATSWRASLARPKANRILDLGCGIGSVGLTTLWRLDNPAATIVGVEAQDISVALARKTIAYNKLEDRVTIVQGDLRDPNVLPAGSEFELVTGSPPYIPPGKGVLSPFSQRAHARIELRGSVFDYCAAARRFMAPGSRFAYVMAAHDPRTDEAPAHHGLVIVERWEFVFRAGGPFHVSVVVCAREEDGPFEPRVTGQLVIRDLAGEWTPEYLEFRKQMGMPMGSPDKPPRGSRRS
jgi:tRNA1Val (adenine37-N6)-methyltransferase